MSYHLRAIGTGLLFMVLICAGIGLAAVVLAWQPLVLLGTMMAGLGIGIGHAMTERRQ